MPSTPAGPAAVHQRRLGNGLRVVVAPDASSPVVAVAVHYDVGFRSEPQGRTGFAHLFEHLLFQGSAHVGKMEHARLVQGAGGIMNGSTRPDYTNYFQVVPSAALDLVLWLEADRMRGPALTQENLDNQVAVVTEEIQVNVTNQPYGGFPWIVLPPLLFDTFANAHNGYGDVRELQAATLDDARGFFDRYYAPGNAVLTVVGDVDPDDALALAERHFGDVPERGTPARPSFLEPPLTAPRRSQVVDRLAPLPAVALGWRSGDPIADPQRHLAAVVTDSLLADGDASRLRRRLVFDESLVLDVSAYLGTFGDPFDSPGPLPHQVVAHHALEVAVDDVIAAVDDELVRLAETGPEPDELERTLAVLVAEHLHRVDPVLGRAQLLSAYALQRGRPQDVAAIPDQLAAVTAEQVRAAAADLRADNRAVLELVPGGSS